MHLAKEDDAEDVNLVCSIVLTEMSPVELMGQVGQCNTVL